jgi:hypothetical protein
MLAPAASLTVERQRAHLRVERSLGVTLLLVTTLAYGLLLATGQVVALPILMAAGCVSLLVTVAIVRRPVTGLYLLVFAALFVEQWGIVGVDPLAWRLHFYETLSGTYGIPIAASPAEMLILVSLVAAVLAAGRTGVRWYRGVLNGPVVFFLLTVVASLVWGIVGANTYSTFWLNAAWAESRSFFYFGAAYLLAAQLIHDRARLRTFVWLIVAAVGLKGLQGIERYAAMRADGQQLESIVAHEDVVFFAAFLLLLSAFFLFQSGRRQRTVMILCAPAVFVTLLVTQRRIGFVVLAAGFLLLGVYLLRARPALFWRLAPVALILLTLYTTAFWNHTGAVAEPVRAIRSVFAPTSERDRLSNAWRDLEKQNIAYNIRNAPVTGLGFGRPYTFLVPEPSLDATGFVYWRYIAHNAIFWVWMKMGVVGFIAFWYLVGSAIVFGLVTLRQLADGYLKAIALTVVGLVVMQVFFSYGDLGLTYSRTMLFLGAMLGVLVRLPSLDCAVAPVAEAVKPTAAGARVMAKAGAS